LEVLELVLEVDFLAVDLACICGGRACAEGDARVVGGVNMVTVLATAITREELGGKTGAGCGSALGQGVTVVVWARGVIIVFWARGVAVVGLAVGGGLVAPQLL